MKKDQSSRFMKHARFPWLALAAGLCLITGSSRVESQTESRSTAASVNGKLTAVKGQELRVETKDETVEVKLTQKTIVRGEIPIKVSDITSGMYVGATAAKQPDGTFRVSRLHVFSEDQRGTGEGHRPLSSAPQSGLTMTNANVEAVEDALVENVKDRMLTLKYKGGQARFVVPPDTPVVKRVLGDSSLLKPGAVVSIQTSRASDGSLAASQITVRASM